DTSNIHRTRRPARSAGILIACFGTTTLRLPRNGKSRAREFIRKLERTRGDWLQNRSETGQMDCSLVCEKSTTFNAELAELAGASKFSACFACSALIVVAIVSGAT